MNSIEQQATQFLSEFAATLNSANSDALPDFFTNDGVFMPEGFKSIPSSFLGDNGRRFFNNCKFRIAFKLDNVIDKGDLILVEATTKTNTATITDNKEVTKTSRDLFVLQSAKNNLKIVRYIFNNVKEI